MFCGEAKFSLFALVGILSTVGTAEREGGYYETSSSLPQEKQQDSPHSLHFGNLLWFFLFLHFLPFLPSSIFFKGPMT